MHDDGVLDLSDLNLEHLPVSIATMDWPDLVLFVDEFDLIVAVIANAIDSGACF